jgi:hypothetical protein
VVHFHSYKPQSEPLLNCVSIPSDRMVIEVHDYA